MICDLYAFLNLQEAEPFYFISITCHFEPYKTVRLKYILPYPCFYYHIPVFIHDLKLLKVSDPALCESFSNSYFSARKTETDFSKIAFDHAHEQNNQVLNLGRVLQWRMFFLRLDSSVKWKMFFLRLDSSVI